MYKQKGQTAIEFALIIPLFFLLFFLSIYVGMAFLDYIHYDSAARTIARAISLSPTLEGKQGIINKVKSGDVEDYATSITKLYDKSFTFTPDPISEGDKEITVQVIFTLNDGGGFTRFLFKDFKTSYKMPIEVTPTE